MCSFRQHHYDFNLYSQPTTRRYPVILAAGLFAVLTLLLLDFSFVRYRLLNEALEPTYWSGQKVVTWRWAYMNNKPRRNDRVVYNQSATSYAAACIVAVPGDHILSVHHTIYLNGKPLAAALSAKSLTAYAAFSVPSGFVCILAQKTAPQQLGLSLLPITRLQGKIIGPWQVLLI